MTKKNFSIIVFMLVFFVGVLSVYPAEKKAIKAVEGKTTENLNGKVVFSANNPNCFNSPLKEDNNYTPHKTTFAHNLGVVPGYVTIYFTPGDGNYYMVENRLIDYRWEQLLYGPVTVKVTNKDIVLEISADFDLFAAWDAGTGWTTWKSGYWLVKACK